MLKPIQGLLLVLFLFLPINAFALVENLIPNESITGGGTSSNCPGGLQNWKCIEINNGDTDKHNLRNNAVHVVWGISTSTIPEDAIISLLRLTVVNKIGVCAFCVTFADYTFGIASGTNPLGFVSSTSLSDPLNTSSYVTTINDYTINPFTGNDWVQSELALLLVRGNKTNECVDFFSMTVNCFVRNTFMRVQVQYTLPDVEDQVAAIGLIEDLYLSVYFYLLIFGVVVVLSLGLLTFKYV